MSPSDVNSKIEELHIRVTHHDHRFTEIEERCESISAEMVRGRELINSQLGKVADKLDVLHDDNLLRKGRESIQRETSEFTKWIWPIVVSILGIVVGVVIAMGF